MVATKQLKEEHQAVKLALQILEEISKRLKSKSEVDPKHLENLLEFLQVFVDQCHHSKEEDVLFPAMEKAGVPNEGGPIGMMLLEHNQGRGYIKGLAAGVAGYRKGEEKNSSEIIKNARAYITLLKDHIDKEDNILYTIADMHLSSAEQSKLLKKFEGIEEKKVGKGKHGQFHTMLEHLQKTYLE